MNITYLAPVVGFFTLAIGATAAIWPKQMSKKYGIATGGEGIPYVISTGIRDVFMGLTILILFYRQDWIVLAILNFLIGFVAISDFLIVRKYGDKKIALVHLLGAIAVTGFGACLLIFT